MIEISDWIFLEVLVGSITKTPKDYLKNPPNMLKGPEHTH